MSNTVNTEDFLSDHAEASDPSEVKVKSLAKAIRLLECFTVDKPDLGISEMAEMLHCNKATVHNIAQTFTALGYLAQNPDTQRYRLGLKFLHFSYIINSHISLTTIIEPYLQKIADLTQETVYFGVPYENKVLYLSTKTPNLQTTRRITGEKAPMYCTGLGKCLLAFLPPEKRPVLADSFKAFTHNTITTREALMEELDRIRSRGYAIDNMEHEYGISCVAIPIFGQNGEAIGAVSASGPSLRFDVNAIENIYTTMRNTLAEVQYIYS